MAIPVPGCCDTQYDLIRKILLGLPDISTGGGGGTTAKYLVNNALLVVADGPLQQLVQPNGDVVFDWAAGELHYTSAPTIVAIDLFNGFLLDGAAVRSVDFSGRQLFDSALVVSIDWETRQAFRAIGSLAMDWASANLIDGAGVITVDWGAKVLRTGAFVTVNWVSAFLSDGTFHSVEWGSRELKDSAGVVTLNWDTLDMTGAWTVNGQPIQATVQTQAANYAAVVADGTILVDATGAARTITLPSAIGISGKVFDIKKIDASVNSVTIATVGGQTIDGAATQVTIVQWTSFTVQSDGTNWFII